MVSQFQHLEKQSVVGTNGGSWALLVKSGTSHFHLFQTFSLSLPKDSVDISLKAGMAELG